MSIFVTPVQSVSNTRIFVTELTDGKQLTVYQTTFASALQEDGLKTKLIIPFPNRTESGQAGADITLWDLTAYSQFFRDCADFLPAPRSAAKPASRIKVTSAIPRAILPEQCDYKVVASFSDLLALREVPAGSTVMAQLSSGYKTGFGFVICYYDGDGETPPLAIVHEKLSDLQLFVPTLGENCGPVWFAPRRIWDHDLYIINGPPYPEKGHILPFHCPLSSLVSYDRVNFVSWDKHTTIFRRNQLPPEFPIGAPGRLAGSAVRIRIAGEQDNGDLALTLQAGVGPKDPVDNKDLMVDKYGNPHRWVEIGFVLLLLAILASFLIVPLYKSMYTPM